MAVSNRPDTGTMGEPKEKRVLHKFMVFGDRVHEIHTVVVHRFLMGDVDDPDLYAAEPLLSWQNSEVGKWVMSKAIDTPEWHRQLEPMTYGHSYAIVARLKDIDYTFWSLKWANTASIAK